LKCLLTWSKQLLTTSKLGSKARAAWSCGRRASSVTRTSLNLRYRVDVSGRHMVGRAVVQRHGVTRRRVAAPLCYAVGTRRVIGARRGSARVAWSARPAWSARVAWSSCAVRHAPLWTSLPLCVRPSPHVCSSCPPSCRAVVCASSRVAALGPAHLPCRHALGYHHERDHDARRRHTRHWQR